MTAPRYVRLPERPRPGEKLLSLPGTPPGRSAWDAVTEETRCQETDGDRPCIMVCHSHVPWANHTAPDGTHWAQRKAER